MKMLKKETLYWNIIRRLVVITFIISGIGFWASWSKLAEAACTPIPETSFSIDAISNLTAALVNPGTVDNTDVDATGCDLGVYFSPGQSGSVSNSTIHDARIAGIVNNGAKVPIFSNAINQIGDNPLDGVQYGLGILVYGLDSPVSGDIKFNNIWNYQKGGIVVKGANGLDVLNNTVIGQGPVDFIGQNGITLEYGNNSTISGNQVFGNSYTGAGEVSSAGILLIGGPCFSGQPSQTNTTITNNDLEGNDVGVWLANLQSDCVTSVSSPTKNVVMTNVIRNNGIFNTTGDITGAYQAGVAILGDKDKVVNNSICGIGYTPVASPPPFLYSVDAGSANSPTVSNNNCNNGSNGKQNGHDNNGNHHGTPHGDSD